MWSFWFWKTNVTSVHRESGCEFLVNKFRDVLRMKLRSNELQVVDDCIVHRVNSTGRYTAEEASSFVRYSHERRSKAVPLERLHIFSEDRETSLTKNLHWSHPFFVKVWGKTNCYLTFRNKLVMFLLITSSCCLSQWGLEHATVDFSNEWGSLRGLLSCFFV